MTETERLIEQAASDLQIKATIATKASDPNTYKVTFFRSERWTYGDGVELKITDGMDYVAIQDALKAAYSLVGK